MIVPAESKGSLQNQLLDYLLGKAQGSPLHACFLNILLAKLIPFNKPHGIRVQSLTDSGVETLLPYRQQNVNHLQGLHACALVTAAEFASGIALVRWVGLSRYRLLMRELSAVYHKQGRADARAICECSVSWINEYVLTPLQSQEEIEVVLTPKLLAADGTPLCDVTVKWQIKHWVAVKKVSNMDRVEC